MSDQPPAPAEDGTHPGAMFQNWPENLPRKDLVRLLRGYANECRNVEQRIASAFPDQYPLGDGDVVSSSERVVIDEGAEDMAILATDEIVSLRASLASIAVAAGLAEDATPEEVRGAVERQHQRDQQLTEIAHHHTPVADRAGGLSGYCPECELVSPCPTLAWATTVRDVALAPWDPADDEVSAWEGR